MNLFPLKSFLLVLIGAVLVFNSPTVAEEPYPDELKGLVKIPGTRFGLELELLPETLAPLTRFFDFRGLQKFFRNRSRGDEFLVDREQNFRESFFDDYLENNPDLFWDLPLQWQLNLGEGLSIPISTVFVASSLAHLEEARRADQQIEYMEQLALSQSTELFRGQNGESSNEGQGLVRPNEGQAPLIDMPLGERDQFAEFEDRVQVQNDLRILNERWKKLDFATKYKLVSWEHLSAFKKATIMYEKVSQVTLKKDIPKKIKRLLSKLYWSRDMKAVEFHYRENIKIYSLRRFYEDLTQLAKLAGPRIFRQVKSPGDLRTNKYRGFSLHYHISVPGADFTRLAPKINKWLALLRLNEGIVSDAKEFGILSGSHYQNNVEIRGLLRLLEKNRLEISSHSLDLEKELAFIVKLTQMPDEEANQVIDQEIRRLVTLDVVQLVAKYKSEFLYEFIEYLDMSEIQGANSGIRQDIVEELKFGRDRWELFIEWIHESDKDFTEFSKNPLRLARVPKFKRHLQLQFQTPSGKGYEENRFRVAFLSAMQLSQNGLWTFIYADLLNDWIHSFDYKLRRLTLDGISGQYVYPRSIYKALAHNIKSEDLHRTMDSLEFLKGMRNHRFPSVIWQALEYRLSHLEAFAGMAERIKAIFDAMKSKKNLPNEIWERVNEVLMSERHTRFTLSFFNGRNRLPKSTWEKLGMVFLSLPDNDVDTFLEFENFLEDRKIPKSFYDYVKRGLHSKSKALRQLSQEILDQKEAGLEKYHSEPHYYKTFAEEVQWRIENQRQEESCLRLLSGSS